MKMTMNRRLKNFGKMITSRWFVCVSSGRSALLGGKVKILKLFVIIVLKDIFLTIIIHNTSLPPKNFLLQFLKMNSSSHDKILLLKTCFPASETLRTLARVVVECWHHSPPVRLTALRVKKTLAR